MLFELFIQNIEPLNIAGYHRGCSAKKPPLANRKLLHFSPWLRNMMREEKNIIQNVQLLHTIDHKLQVRGNRIILSQILVTDQ